MLRRLLPSSIRPAAATATATAARALSQSAAAAAEGGGLRQAAFGVIKQAPKPMHNREVFKALDAALPKDVSVVLDGIVGWLMDRIRRLVDWLDDAIPDD